MLKLYVCVKEFKEGKRTYPDGLMLYRTLFSLPLPMDNNDPISDYWEELDI